MEHLYNPDQMSESEIKQTFVARQPLIDKLIARLENQPAGAGVQHTVLVAPRGMGKTTVLLMLKFSIADRGLDKIWLALRFPEEMYGVNDLADFWLEVVEEVARETEDTELKKTITKLRTTYTRSSDLEEALLALLHDWCRKHTRRLVLLVDNFDLILEQIGNEQDNASLRRVLMNDGFLTLVGAAPSFFHEARGYDEPLYNFFRIENLKVLTYEEMEALLIRRAEADGCIELVTQLKENTGRLRALEYFTGGNTRLILMLYAVLSQSGLIEARQGLERLLDQVTPFYKAKTEALPPQQRKIIDTLARLVGERHEGVTPAAIAEHSRLTPQVVSAQLKRLLEAGYVQVANIRSRRSFYTLSEPLYSLWHQMRFGRDARQRMGWLVSFLKSWYEPQEISRELGRWNHKFREAMAARNSKDARIALEYRRWFAEAEEESSRKEALYNLTKDCASFNDPKVFKELSLPYIRDKIVSSEVLAVRELLDQLATKFNPSEWTTWQQMISDPYVGTGMFWHVAGRLSVEAGRLEEAATRYDRSLKIDQSKSMVWTEYGNCLYALERYDDAVENYDCAIKLEKDNIRAWNGRGLSLAELDRHNEAIESYNQVLMINPNSTRALNNSALSSQALGYWEQAIEKYDQALNIDPEYFNAHINRIVPLIQLERFNEALKNCEANIKEYSYCSISWRHHGDILWKLQKFDDAILSYKNALQIDPKDAQSLSNCGSILLELNRAEEALFYFKQITKILPENDTQSWMAYLGIIYSGVIGADARAMIEAWGSIIENRGTPTDVFEEMECILIKLIDQSRIPLIRQLLVFPAAQERFFPLARALAYHDTRDQDLLEKLAPEMRPIVEEVVAKLDLVDPPSNTKVKS